MRQQLAALFAGGAFITLSGAGLAHHSFAMFDQEHPIQLAGVVQAFKFTSPHTFILLQVKDQDGSTTVWNLEGNAPSNLVRDGWSEGDTWSFRAFKRMPAWHPCLTPRDGRPSRGR